METQEEKISKIKENIDNMEWDIVKVSHLFPDKNSDKIYVLYINKNKYNTELLLQVLSGVLNIEREEAEDIEFVMKLSSKKVVLRVSNNRKELHELSKIFSIYNISTDIKKVKI